MAKSATMRDYTVSFANAAPNMMGGNKYWQISISDWFSAEKHPVTAHTFADLEQQVRALAAAEKRHVSPSIRLADPKARKPAGFDHFCRTLHVIEYVPPAETVPAGWAEVAA